MRLIFFEGHSYLEAWCLRAEEVRMFRLDRMRSCRGARAGLGPSRQTPRGSICPTGSFSLTSPIPSAVLELQPQARWVADYYPVETQTELPDGGLRVELRFSNNGWLERLVTAARWLCQTARTGRTGPRGARARQRSTAQLRELTTDAGNPRPDRRRNTSK